MSSWKKLMTLARQTALCISLSSRSLADLTWHQPPCQAPWAAVVTMTQALFLAASHLKSRASSRGMILRTCSICSSATRMTQGMTLAQEWSHLALYQARKKRKASLSEVKKTLLKTSCSSLQTKRKSHRCLICWMDREASCPNKSVNWQEKETPSFIIGHIVVQLQLLC